jgi:hypothetical protein
MARTRWSTTFRTAGITIGLAITLAAFAPAAFAQDALVGVWGVTATPRSCATTAPLGPPLRSLVTFNQDGTSRESLTLLLFSPGQRSEGHGIWRRTGNLTYSNQLLGVIAFETPPNTPPGSPGFAAGWTITSATITLTGPDRFESTNSTAFYDLNRATYRPSACATTVGERFK